MKSILGILFLFFGNLSMVSQTNSFYKEGDTLFYKNNRATYLKTNTFVIIKKANIPSNNSYNVDKYVRDTESNTFILTSNFTTIGLQVLKSNGAFKSYHKNGNIATEGATVNGRIGNGIWTYYYENGKKKSEEKLSQETFFSDNQSNLVMSFWDLSGNKTVENGNGSAEFSSNEENLIHKGSYKKGLKNGTWAAFKGDTKVYEETYKKGKMIKGKSWISSGEAFLYKELNTNPYFRKKDNSSVKKYIEKRFKSNSSNINGTIVMNFTVTKEGKLKDFSVERGLAGTYNAEIIKILSEMDNWTPAKKRGQSFDAPFKLQLNF